jgi:hypothetical protein
VGRLAGGFNRPFLFFCDLCFLFGVNLSMTVRTQQVTLIQLLFDLVPTSVVPSYSEVLLIRTSVMKVHGVWATIVAATHAFTSEVLDRSLLDSPSPFNNPVVPKLLARHNPGGLQEK